MPTPESGRASLRHGHAMGASPSASSAALREANGPDAPVTPEALAPIDHFHGRGVLATEELVALLKPLPGERLLDIGSGDRRAGALDRREMRRVTSPASI